MLPRERSEEYAMRFSVAVGSFFFAATLVAVAWSGQLQGSSPEEAAIRKVLGVQQEAWNRGDVNAFLEGYWHSAELTFSGSSGVARGFDGVRARYQKNYPDRAAMGKLDFSGLEVRMLGPDAALALGRWHLTRAQGDIGGVFSLVFQKFPKDGWRIIHDHTSVVNSEAH
jgi:uncharacterized protein (TIGR02246 family)